LFRKTEKKHQGIELSSKVRRERIRIFVLFFPINQVRKTKHTVCDK
jgi:hypothetical protein